MRRCTVAVAISELTSLSIPAGIFEVDGTTIMVNASGEQLLGRSCSELVGQKSWFFAPGGDYLWPVAMADAREHGIYRGDIAIATPRRIQPIRYVALLCGDADHTFAVVFAFDAADASNEAALDVVLGTWLA